MSGIVESCPGNSTGYAEASSRLNCSRDQYGNDQYICVPNVNKTALVEFCFNGIMGFRQRGYCLEVSEGDLFKSNCTGFVEGCPETHYRINKIYKYPACQRINTDYKCYLADPSCPNKTREFTTEDTWGSSTESFVTPFEFSNTTEKGVHTTLPTNAGPVGTIIGGLVAGVVIIGIVLAVIGIIVWKRRKKRTKTDTIIPILCINRRKKRTRRYESERRRSTTSNDSIRERQNIANLENKRKSLDNNDTGVSESTHLLEQPTYEISDGTPPTIHEESEMEGVTLVKDIVTLSDVYEERRHSRHVDDEIRGRQNLGNLENGSESLINNAARISESEHLLKQVFDDDSSTTEREEAFEEWKQRKIQEKTKAMGDYSVWKTEISDQFSSLSDDEVCVLFCFLCSDSGTPDFTDTDGLDILNEIREKVYDKDSVTSEKAQRTLDRLKSRGFLWDQDGGDMTEDVKDETVYRVIERRVTERHFTRSPMYPLFSYTTAVRYLRSRRYTRKSGEKCVISDDPLCDSLLIHRLQMNILTHVTMKDTRICNEVSQIWDVGWCSNTMWWMSMNGIYHTGRWVPAHVL